MAFDLKSAKPFDLSSATEVKSTGGFDLASAKEAPKTSLWEDVKISGVGAFENMDRWDTGLDIAMSSLLGNDEAATDKYTKLQERIKKRKEWANPENKTQGFGDKALGMLGSLPLQLAAFPFSPAGTGQTMLENGETLGKAAAGTAVDTLGNMAGVALPGAMGTSVLGKAASGALINAGQDTATRKAISALADKQATKDMFDPTWETLGLSAIIGGAMGPLSPTTKKKSDVKPVNERLAKTPQQKVKLDIPELLIPELRIESPIAAENRVRSMKQTRGADDWNSMDAAAKAVEEEIAATEAMQRFEQQQAQMAYDAAELAKAEEFRTKAQQDSIVEDFGNNDPMARMPEMRVDENGMPIRADLSMEAQNLQNPLQRNLWGDELPIRSGDGGLPLTQALDSMARGPDREIAISNLRGYTEEGRIKDIQNSVGITDEMSRLEGEGGRGGMGRGQRGGLDIQGIGEGVSKLVDKFRQGSNKEWVQDFLNEKLYPDRTDPDTVLAAAKQETPETRGNVLSRPTQNFAAGGTLEGMKRNSALVTGVSRIMQRAKNIGEDKQKMQVFPVEGAFRKVKSEQLVKLTEALLDENINKTRFSTEDLAARGLGVDALLAYDKYRTMMDDAFEYQNAVREAMGKKPIGREEAYMTNAREGDFIQIIKDSEGKTVWAIGGNTKRDVRMQLDAIMKEFPDLKPDNIITRKSSRSGFDAHIMYNEMLDLLGENDPVVAKIREWADIKVQQQGQPYLGQLQHFKNKINARGFLGDRPVNTIDLTESVKQGKAVGKFDPQKEALAQIQASIDYAKNAYAWGEMQLAMSDLTKIINDEQLLRDQPRNMAFVRDYVLSNLGMNDSIVAKAIDDTLRAGGITPSNVVKHINDIKGLWITQKLLGAGHYAANILQAANMAPHITDIYSKYGGNPVKAVTYGTYMGMLTGTSHTLHSAFGKGPQNAAVYKAMKTAGLSDFDMRAVKYAEDNSITTRSIYDESPIATEFTTTGKVKRSATRIIAAPETFLRATAFMTYAKMLESSGKFKSDLDLFRRAEEYTNASMGDYRGSERAMVFDKLGSSATAVNTFSTFPINYFNQWSWVTREMGRGNPGPFAAMFMTQYLLAGAMGIPGFNDMDQIWNWMKDMLKTADPLMWNKVKNIDLKDAALAAGGNVGLYGAPSVLSEYALTSRVSAPAGIDMTGTPAAPWIDMAKIAGNAVGVARSPSNSQKWAELTHSVAPAGMQSFVENTMFRDQMSVPAERDGVQGRIVGKPTDLSDRKGQVFRTPEMEEKRVLGLRAQSEQFERDFAYKARKRQQDVREVSRELVNKTYNQIRNGNMDKARDFIQLYTKLTGKQMTQEMFTTRMVNEFTTGSERAFMDISSVEGMIAAKRLKMLLDEQKATEE